MSYFIERFSENAPVQIHLSGEARIALYEYKYPGNVRELENAVRRAIALSSNGVITLDCLPPDIAASTTAVGGGGPAVQRLIADRPGMEELQRRYLELVLDETGWNRRRAAAILNLDRRTIQRLIARYKLQGHFPDKTALEEESEGEDEKGNHEDTGLRQLMSS